MYLVVLCQLDKWHMLKGLTEVRLHKFLITIFR